MGGAAAEEVGVEREDHVRLAEAVDRVHRAAEGECAQAGAGGLAVLLKPGRGGDPGQA